MTGQRWAESGLVIINQLLDGQVFKSFSQLRDKFDLPSSDLSNIPYVQKINDGYVRQYNTHKAMMGTGAERNNR